MMGWVRLARRGAYLSWLAIAMISWAWMSVNAQPGPLISSTTASYKHSSSLIAITPDGALLLVVNPDSNSLTLVDTASLAVLAELAVGVDPRSVAVSPDGQVALVANQSSDSLSVVDLQQHLVTATLEVGDRPLGVAFTHDGSRIAVAELGQDQIRLIEVQTLQTVALVPVADRPYSLAFTPDNRLLVTHLLSGNLTVIVFQPFRTFLPFVRVSGSSGSLAGTPPSAPDFTLPALVVRSIATWPNVAPAPGITVNAEGRRAYLPQSMANGLGYNASFDTTVFAKVSVIDLQAEAHLPSEHISIPDLDRPVGLPWDVALAKDDSELWVVNAASNDLSVFDISTPTLPNPVASLSLGDNPRGIVIAPDGSRAYVNNTLAGTVSVIDAETYTVTQVITTTQIPLPPALLHGKRLYFSSADPKLALARWISCNTCHIEGEADGRTWLLQYLGEVPPGEEPFVKRNTTSLLGMIETYPLRWSAEWDESADSEFSVRFEQFGSGLIDGEMYPTLGLPNQGRSFDLDCLALYIDSLALPTPTDPLGEVELRGKAIFESAQTQCAACHPSPLFTDLQVHDVGTADGEGEWFGPLIDTPSLRYLYDSAPYLHDGSAVTMLDVLTTCNPEDQHGVTSHLTSQELQDLVAFLLAIPNLEDR